jgi:hypothetical protein
MPRDCQAQWRARLDEIASAISFEERAADDAAAPELAREHIVNAGRLRAERTHILLSGPLSCSPNTDDRARALRYGAIMMRRTGT